MGLSGNNALIERILEKSIEEKSNQSRDNSIGENIKTGLLQGLQEAELMDQRTRVDDK